MSRLHVIAFAGAAALSATAAFAAAPEWRTTTVALPDGSQAEIRYVGEVPPQVTVSMPVVQQPQAAVVEAETADAGILRARRIVQPPQPTPLVPPPAPQLVIAADGKVCAQRTEWTSRGRGKEPSVRRTDTGEGCAALLVPVAPLPAAPAITPLNPDES